MQRIAFFKRSRSLVIFFLKEFVAFATQRTQTRKTTAKIEIFFINNVLLYFFKKGFSVHWIQSVFRVLASDRLLTRQHSNVPLSCTCSEQNKKLAIWCKPIHSDVVWWFGAFWLSISLSIWPSGFRCVCLMANDSKHSSTTHRPVFLFVPINTVL